jgi:hypothetical protein
MAAMMYFMPKSSRFMCGRMVFAGGLLPLMKGLAPVPNSLKMRFFIS